MNLLERTKALARTRDYDRATVCAELGVTTRWLHRLLAGHYQDPGVNKIERLHEMLSRAPIKEDAV